MQPIKVYNAPQGRGPNPWKVNIVLEELGLPHETVWVPYGEIKSEPYTSLNPNGRVPAMVDPNKNVTLWESGAIVNYLIATYDKDLKLTYGDDRLQEKWQLQSWLMFQMSGQGPMFGQKGMCLETWGGFQSRLHTYLSNSLVHRIYCWNHSVILRVGI